MYTYEMVKLADEDGKTYTCGDSPNSFKYSKEKGFYTDNNPGCGEVMFVKGGLSNFVHIDKWEELKPKEMSLYAIEKVLGYPVRVNQWISVKDALPKGTDDVLTLRERSKKNIFRAEVAFYTSEGWKSKGWLPINVDYWQPLPGDKNIE